jgi:antitoxin component of MazEF toxin-antitoxin module
MPFIVTSSQNDVISLPPRIMKLLNLSDGDEVKTVVEGRSLRLSPLDRFLSLRGVLSEDDTFDKSMEQLDRKWQSWTDESV